MSFLGKLFSGFQPRKSLNTSIFSFFSNTSIPHMGSKEVLNAYRGWTYACVNAIAEAFAEIELTLQEKTKDGWTNIDEHKALDLLHKVNNFQSFLDLTYATQAYLELDGNAFWYLPRNGLNAPAEIWYLDPTRMQIVKSEKDFIAGYVFTTEKNEKIPFETFEIIHFKRFNPKDKYRGIGTVQAAAIAIDTDNFASEWQRNFFGNSAMPSGILSSEGTLTPEQYERIKASWDARYGGAANAHKTAVLEGGLKYMALTPTLKEMQFTESRKDTRDEILAIFRVPKPVLGILEDINLASAQVADLIFTKYTVKPKMRFFVDRLNEFYLPLFKLDSKKYRLHFKDPVAENVEQKRADRESGIKNYYLKPNEARAQIGLEPVEGGDELYIPAGMVRLSQVATVSQTDIQDDDQGNANDAGGKGATKAVRVKKNGKTRRVDTPLNAEYIDEEITKQHEVYLDLNADLQKLLLKNLKKAKSADSEIEKIARAVNKDATDELVRLLFEDYGDWIGILYNATKEGMERVLGRSGKDTLALLEVNGEFDLQHPRVLDWLNEHALEASNSYSDTMKEDITLKVMEGVELGVSNDDIADTIKQFFTDQSDYRAMRIARTETINAYGAGALEGYKQSGVVKGKYWMPDNEACEICLGNAAKGVIGLYSEFPSGHQAPAGHPHCLIGDTNIAAEGVMKTFKRWFEGEVITISISGHNLTATPNHPILTDRGWVAAGALKVGDNVYQRTDWNSLVDNPDDDYIISRIDKVTDSLKMSSSVVPISMPLTTEAFHGDGIANTEVEIVYTDSLLSHNGKIKSGQLTKQQPFRCTHHRGIGLNGKGMLDLGLKGNSATSDSVMSSRNTPSSGRGIVPTVFDNSRLSMGSNSKVKKVESLPETTTTDTDALSNITRRFASQIALVKVDNLSRSEFSGHVYNVETKNGFYIAESIITHNCECSLGAVVNES